MEFIYHAVPKDMIGQTLYPLFELRRLHPSLYEDAVKKYDDHPKRKELPNKLIRALNCARGDVLHFSSVHPARVFAALKTVFPDGNRQVRFFKIPFERINVPAVLFDMNRREYAFGEEDPDEAFDILDSDRYREVKIVPQQAYDFYWEWQRRGEPGAPAWGKIPHVFVRGAVNVAGCEVIDWRDLVI